MPTVADLLRTQSPRCSLGCPVLDACLQGGIPTRGITELVGESTAAKTQLCLQLLLTAQVGSNHDRKITHMVKHGPPFKNLLFIERSRSL
jgi:RecA/RadA recombinase